MCFDNPIAFGPSNCCSRCSAGPISAPPVVPNRVPAAALAFSILPSSAAAAALASFPRFGPSKSCSRCSAGLIPVFGPGLVPALLSFQIVLPLQRWPHFRRSWPHSRASVLPNRAPVQCDAVLCTAMRCHALRCNALTCSA